MGITPDKAKAFLAEWDAVVDGQRADRKKVAENWNYNRSHAYDFAARCREVLRTAQQQKGPLPSG